MNTSLQIFTSHVTAHELEAYQLNDYLADHPELSGEEKLACARFIKLCKHQGMTVEANFAGQPTAFRAIVSRTKNPLGRLAILAEYDALPGLGHACGHSVSGSMSYLAAVALHEMAHTFTMDIDLIGTPDEELRGGKAMMTQQDIFKNYDFAIMVHAKATRSYPCSRFLALSNYRIKFHGKPAHAAANPWDGRNALNGAMLALHAIDMLRQQVRPETRIGSYIINGGVAANIIPELTEIECCIRHTERKYLDTVVLRVMNCIHGAAKATETTVDIEEYGLLFDNLLWNETGTQIICQVMDRLNIIHEDCDQSALGSSDMGNVSYQCPAFHPTLGISDHEFADHTRDMAAAVKNKAAKPAITKGAKIIGYTLLTLMADPAKLTAIKAEFKERLRHNK